MLIVPGCREEHFVSDPRIELARSGAEDCADSGLVIGIRRPAVSELFRPAHLLAVCVGHDERLDRPVGPPSVDDAPVGERRHGELREAREHLVEVERAVEDLRRLGEKALGLLRPLQVGDVPEDRDRGLDLPRAVPQRPGARDRPALVSGRPDSETEGDRGRLVFTGQREASRQALDRKRLARLVHDVEALHDVPERRFEELADRGRAECLRGGLVRVLEAAVAGEDDDPVADARQDRLEERPLVLCSRCQRRLHRATPSIVSRRSGEGGIRTLEGGYYPLNALAGRRLQPLGHFSVRGHGNNPSGRLQRRMAPPGEAKTLVRRGPTRASRAHVGPVATSALTGARTER